MTERSLLRTASCFVSALVLASSVALAAPVDVTDFQATATTPHSISLTWTAYDSADFARYEVRRDRSPGVTRDDSLVDTLTSSTTTTLADSGLTAHSTYYYKILVIDTTDTASVGLETNARTLSLYYPHTNDVDSVNAELTVNAPWALVRDGDYAAQDTAYTGDWHWTDSPGSSYPPSMDASLTMTVNLGTAIMPVLTYWERYSFQTNVDYGYIEVSINGSSWTRIAFVTGSQTVWAQRRLDLTQWAGYGEVRIRFRSMSNGSTEADGWHIDDITIDETDTPIVPYPLVDTFEQGNVDNWFASSWSLTTGGHTAPNAITDSKTGNYPPDIWNAVVSAGVLDLSAATNPVLTFWHKHSFFTDHACCYHNEDDYGRVYVSADYGRPGSWVQIAYYTGSLASWTKVQLDLRQFAGSSTVRVMFIVDDNIDHGYSANRQAGGWDLDDIRVEELPSDVSLLPIASSSMHHATLDWTQNVDGDFERYEVRRATSASVTRSSQLLATITDAATMTLTDTVAMIEPTQYSYRVYVIDTLGTASLGSEVQTATYTVPTNTFAFQDSMDVATTNWAWGAPWGATTTTFHSAPSSWTDSPGASYTNNVNTALATVVNLSGSAEPVLTFWHRYDLETNGDYGRVEVSSDGGATWSAVLTVTGTDSSWQRERISLNTWIGETIGLRFRLQSNASASRDGWYIDDVDISNSSRVVTYPYTDDVENDTTAWFADSPWGHETDNSHSGMRHWSDSPAGSYADNTSSALRIAIDLSGANMPVLRYWERYSFQTNADYGFIEISTNGTSWTQYAFVTGVLADWGERRIDLSELAGNSQVHVRFRTSTNGSSVSDGWHVDDISISETPTPHLPYPFSESFGTDSAANWLVSGWGLATGGSSAPYQITDSPLGNYTKDAYNRLVTAGTFNLSGATNPVLIFWHKYNMFTDHACCYHNEDDYGRVYISDGSGHSGTWSQVGYYTGSQSAWTRVQIDLSAFAGQSSVRLMFVMDDQTDYGYPGTNRQSDGWHIDDVRVEELPVDVAISPIASSSLHHVDLNWTENTDTDFGRYEIFRATSPSVSRSSSLVKTITNRATTTWTDTVSLIEPTRYSYRIYVYDTLATVSLGSNVVTADYTVPVNTFPFVDSMNVGSTSWNWSAPWGPTTNVYHSAPSSWKNDPIQAYRPNTNSALATVVNLAGATSPVLTFWHRYAFQSGVDFGRVEISKDAGATWTEVLRTTGVDTTWNRERIDLGGYVGETIGLRFRLTSNADTQMDGWYIDDVVIANGPRSVAFPLFDDVESGEGSWFANSPWGLSTVGSYSGEWHWTDSPAGNYAPNESSSLTMTIDLSGATAPVMHFQQRYSFQPNYDWGYVEVSTNGGSSWGQEYFVTGSQASWRRESIDLAPYTGNANVLIRFRLASNGSSESDGWHLDDFQVVDVDRVFPYPFTEGFDDSSSVDNWHTSSWEFMTGGRSGPYLMHDSPLGNFPADAFSSLTLAGTVDLRGTTKPTLTFWHKYSLYTNHACCYHNEDDLARVYISPDNGLVWYQMASFKTSNTNWSKVTVDLSGHVGASQLRVRLVIDDQIDYGYPGTNHVSNGWWIDDLRIGEDLAVAAMGDLVKFEGPSHTSAVPGMAGSRLIGSVVEPSVTDAAGQGTNVLGEFGVGELGSMPNDSDWTWFVGGFLDDLGGADRFFGPVRVDSVGTYSIGFRASVDNGLTWVYGDLDGNNLAGGGVSEFEADKAGVLIVGLGGTATLSSDKIERLLRAGDQEIWSIQVGNGGPDPLHWQLFEAGADSVVGDVPWLVPQVAGGVLGNGEGQQVELALDATGLQVDSAYAAHLLLTSNDAGRDSIWLPVSVTVLEPGTPGFSGWASIRGGGKVSGGTVTVIDAADQPIDTVAIAPNGWFASYGLPPGTYRLTIVAPEAYSQEFPNVELPVEGAMLDLSPIHPQVVSPFFMEVFSDASTLDGLPIPLGTVVSVRDPDGVVCGSHVVSTAGSFGLLHVYADDASTPDEDEGAQIGDALRLFVNDVPTSSEVVYTNHNTVSRVDIAANTVAPRHLDTGLHLISLGVAPRDSSLTDVLASIAGSYSYISGFDQGWGGARTYVDSLQAFSDLVALDGYHGYWMRMDAPGDLVVYGGVVHDDVPLALDQGWNLVSYLPAAAMAPADALAGILGDLNVVGGFSAGAQTFVPGSQFSDMTTMEYGHGYWLHMAAPATLNYRYGAMQPMAKPAGDVLAEGDPTPTPEWMDLYGSIYLDGVAVAAGTELGVVDGDGVVCGRMVLREDGEYGFLHVYADDARTEADEGAEHGELLRFLIDGEEPALAPAVAWDGSKTVHRLDLKLSSSPTGVAIDRPLTFALDEARPNPFNPSTTIAYELPSDSHVRIAVYDPLGREVRVLVDRTRSAGRYAAVWNGIDAQGREAASGIYVIRISSEIGTLARRVVLLR